MTQKSHDADTTVTLEGEGDIVIRRSFDAPLTLVFEALHKPEHVRRWWCPSTRGEMTVCEIDFRVGGRWRFMMKTLDGSDVGFSGTYLEIDAPARVVQTEVFDPFPESPSTVTLTLAAQGPRTLMTQHVRYPSREVRDMVLATGMEDGMRESLVQLAAVVASLK